MQLPEDPTPIRAEPGIEFDILAWGILAAATHCLYAYLGAFDNFVPLSKFLDAIFHP